MKDIFSNLKEEKYSAVIDAIKERSLEIYDEFVADIQDKLTETSNEESEEKETESEETTEEESEEESEDK